MNFEELETKIEELEKELNLLREKITEKDTGEIEIGENIKDLSERTEQVETRVLERDKISKDYLMGIKVSGTTSGTPGTQTTHAHNLGKVPKFVFITSKGNGVVYLSASSNNTNIYIKGSAASIDFDTFIIL